MDLKGKCGAGYVGFVYVFDYVFFYPFHCVRAAMAIRILLYGVKQGDVKYNTLSEVCLILWR